MKVSKVFKNERGGFDLGSVMTGVVIVGIAGGVVAATTLGIIPAVQNHVAKSSLASMSMAQSAYKQGTGSYGTLEDLIKEGLLPADFATDMNENISRNGSLCSVVDRSGNYQASAKSESGKYYTVTNHNPAPVEVAAPSATTNTCFSAENYAAYDMALTIDTDIEGCTTFELPISGLNGVQVWWGDSKVGETVTSDYPTHQYFTSGEHTIRLNGEFSRYGKDGMTVTPYTKGSATAHCVTAVKKWQDTNTTNLRFAFDGATNLIDVVQIPATVTDLSYAFRSATSLKGDYVQNWNVSNVTSLAYTFQHAAQFNGNVSNWNTAKVTNMSVLFDGNTKFNRPLNNWNVTNVNNMNFMFRNAHAFNQPLNNWNTGKVTQAAYMFYGAKVFNQNISMWNTANISNFSYMFYGASVFDQPIGTWNTAKATNMSYMFMYAYKFNRPLSTWNVTNVNNMYAMFHSASLFNQNLSSWNTAKVTNMGYMFYRANVYNQPVNTWNVANVTNMYAMFYEAKAFNQPLDTWDTTKVTSMGYMFYNTTVFNQPLTTFDTTNVTNLQAMFALTKVFNQPIGNWNTAKVTNMTSTFQDAKMFNQNISTWSTVGNPTNTNFSVGSPLTAANSPTF